MIKLNVLKQVYESCNVLKAGRKRLLHDNPITNKTTPLDTFVKSADDILPEKIQKLLDDCGPHEKNKKDFIKDLYSTGQKKFEYIYNHKYFKHIPFFNHQEFLKTVRQMSLKELKQTFDEISDLYTKLPQVSYKYDKVAKKLLYEPQVPKAANLAQLTILKAHNKEAYEYLLNHPNKNKLSDMLSYFADNLNGSCFETLTIPQIKQIEGIGTASSLNLKTDIELITKGISSMGRYVESSDFFAKSEIDCKNLHDYLSKKKVIEPFTAFRAEKDTGMFNKVFLDKKLALKTRWNVIKNIFKARKIAVHDYTGNYDNAFVKKKNLFNFILFKKKLTLADAMQTVKFGNESYRNQIINMIKETQITDNRFKSLTFDKNMAEGWLPDQGTANTGIFHNIKVKKGIEGCYSSIENRQAEFILNNNEKHISFQNVKYDPQRDIFFVDSTIE